MIGMIRLFLAALHLHQSWSCSVTQQKQITSDANMQHSAVDIHKLKLTELILKCHYRVTGLFIQR